MRKFILLLWAAPLFAQAPLKPDISPAPGPFTGTQTVTITESTPGYEIHYTVDGSTPIAASPLYTAPVTVSATTTVKAIAIVIPSSAVASATYTLAQPPPTTFNYVLTSPTTALSFSWTVGAAAPGAIQIKISDSSPCPAVPPVPLCHWPTGVTTDQPWLNASTGSTAFISTVSINTIGLVAGTYKGNITFIQSQFKNPTIKIPVMLTVTGGGTPPPAHNVAVKWNAPTGAVDGYNVYRASVTGGPYAKLNPVLLFPSTGYTDSAVVAGSKYFYTVRAVKSSTESDNSNEAAATVPTP